MCRLFWKLGASTSWNPLGLSRAVMGLLYLYLYLYILQHTAVCRTWIRYDSLLFNAGYGDCKLTIPSTVVRLSNGENTFSLLWSLWGRRHLVWTPEGPSLGVKGRRREFRYTSVSSGIIPTIKLLNRFIYFHENYYEHYATGKCSKRYFLFPYCGPYYFALSWQDCTA